MKISNKTWHYKWFAKDWDTMPKALCWYFWKVVGSVILHFAMICIAVGAGAVVAAIITYPIWQIFFHIDNPGPIVLSFLVWSAIGIFILREYRIHLIDSGKVKRREQKPRGLVSSYVHAKHRRICPLLTYGDD